MLDAYLILSLGLLNNIASGLHKPNLYNAEIPEAYVMQFIFSLHKNKH